MDETAASGIWVCSREVRKWYVRRHAADLHRAAHSCFLLLLVDALRERVASAGREEPVLLEARRGLWCGWCGFGQKAWGVVSSTQVQAGGDSWLTFGADRSFRRHAYS